MACLFLKGKMMSDNNQTRSIWARLVPDYEAQGRDAQLNEIIVDGSQELKNLEAEMTARLTRLREQGVKNITFTFQKGSMSTFEGLSALNNVLRLYEEGAGERKTISPQSAPSAAQNSDPDLTP
jgi:hypothetical protein